MSGTELPAAIRTPRLAAGENGDHVTYCRICEACCGLVATVWDGRVTKVVPDRLNPHSQGHACVKGISFAELNDDPDRVVHPLRRIAGTDRFEQVGWDDALDDIATRLGAIRAESGPESIAFYIGNPTSFCVNTAVAHGGLMRAIGSRKGFSPGSQDSNARMVANFVVYGSAMRSSFPDLPRCDFLLVVGANPLVSNGSLLFAPRLRHDLDAIAERGRVVVVDPRRTETARRYEHVAIRPNGDVWLLLALIAVLYQEDLVDRAALALRADGADRLEQEVQRIGVADAAARCDVPEGTIRDIARAFAATPRAAVYSRVGICRGPFATLSNILVTALNAIGGKCGVPGGDVFGITMLAGSERSHVGGYAEATTRIGDLPTVVRYSPSAVLADEILTPGEGQVRALLVTAGNPMLSAPGGERLQCALDGLDLLVSFDMYVNETSRRADYVLPATTFLERADFPYVGMSVLSRPFVQYTDAVVPPRGEARHEHEVYRDIVERMGLAWPTRGKPRADGSPPSPLESYDDMLRDGPAGDAHGDRDGWSFERLRDHRHGVMVDGLSDAADGWREKIAYPDGRLRLWHDLTAAEFARLWAERADAPELMLIGRRDIRSINSWMHNLDRLVRSQQAALLVHPADAARHGVASGDVVRVSTRFGSVEIEVEISDEVGEGTLCYPHGWGHDGSWQRANRTPGRNINVLLGTGPEAVEAVSGTTLMDGLPVTLERLGAPTTA